MPKNKEIEIGIPSIGIPGEVLFNPELTPTEKIFFGLLRNLSKSKRGCWASNRYLGDLIGVGKQTISNSIANLDKFGYIIVKRSSDKKGNKQRNIFIDLKYTEKYKSLIESVHDMVYKNNYIGYYNLENENYDEALQYFRRALEINERLINLKGKAVNLNNIGRIFDELGKIEEAKEKYAKALQIL